MSQLFSFVHIGLRFWARAPQVASSLPICNVQVKSDFEGKKETLELSPSLPLPASVYVLPPGCLSV